MKIQGLQKLTLLDYPGKTACSIFIGGCNFRCPFCHNAYLVLSPDSITEIKQEELFAFLKKRVNVLDGVCVTGGEPLLYEGTKTLLKDIKQMGYLVKLDTNGSFPQRLSDIIENELVDYVAMDIKNSREKYAETIGVTNFDTCAVEKSAEMLMKGKIPFEFRTTVVSQLHDEEDFISIGKWLRGNEKYFLQSFLPSVNIIKSGLSPYKNSELVRFADILKEYIPNTNIRGI